jgi:hypothetical protein
MKLFNVLAATAAANPLLNCDVSTLFASTCSLSGFDLSIAGGLSSECSSLANDGGFKVVVVPKDAVAPGDAAQTCTATTLDNDATAWTHAVMDSSDTTLANCWSSADTTSDDVVISADIYVVDASNNRPFNKVQVSCTMSKTVTVTDLTYAVTESAVAGPVETAAATTLAVQARRDGTEDTSGIYPIGSNVFFYVSPPTIHSALTFTAGGCTADGTTINAAWTYGLTDSDCSMTDVESQLGPNSFGACMRIYATNNPTTTISCTASLTI